MINNNNIDLNNDQFEELLRNDIIQVGPTCLQCIELVSDNQYWDRTVWSTGAPTE